MLSAADISLLDKPLKCKRIGCEGIIPHTTLRKARAWIEHGLRSDSQFRLCGECDKCHVENDFTYSEVYNLIPPQFRPSQLAPIEFWALMMIHEGSTPRGEQCFIAERVLIGCIEEAEGGWVGVLVTTSTLTPSLCVGDVVVGRRFGSFRVCTGLVHDGKTKPLQFATPQPGTTDTGCFFTSPDSPDDLRSAQPFCSNERCCHIIGIYHSHFMSVLKANAAETWFWRGKPMITVDCQRCGVSTVLDEHSYDTLYHV